jgi:GAF domain-containing protein/anti-sigma regulatory factor (Ser/Thr protein kinase)
VLAVPAPGRQAPAVIAPSAPPAERRLAVLQELIGLGGRGHDRHRLAGLVLEVLGRAAPDITSAQLGPDGLVLGDATPDRDRRAFLDAVTAQVGALLAGPATGPEGVTARRLELLQRATAELSAAATPAQVVDVARRHLAGLLSSPAVAVWEREGDVVRAGAMDGWEPSVVRDWTELPLGGATPVADATRTHRTVLMERAADWEREYPHLVDLVAASGYRALAVWPLVVAGQGLGALAVGFAHPRVLGTEERATAAALAEQCGQAVARSRLLEAESAARRDAVGLGAALSALSAAADLRAVATVLVEQGVAAGAVAAVVALRGEHHDRYAADLEIVAAVGYPGDGPRRLTGHGPLSAARAEPAWEVAAPAWGGAAQPYPVHAVIPLHVAGGHIGSLGLRWAGDPPGPSQRALLLTVAGQGAQALDRVRLQQAEHEVAVTLQRVLLPAATPRLDRLAVATRYLPAGAGARAGGDWYDVIPLGDGAGGRVAIVVGDVVGHGPHAAGVMGQLRSALAAYLLDDHGPAEALERLDRFARRVDGAAASTVACGVLDRHSGELTWARAGHVPALVIDDAGGRFLVGGAGTVLGVRRRPPVAEQVTVLEPGSSVVLYTDGLVERRGEDVDVGLARLQRAAVELRDLDPEPLAAGLLTRCLGGRRVDDVALVVIRLLPAPLENRRPAVPAQLGEMRREVRAWARAAALPADQLGDLQLTLGEAVANAVEHAYPREPGGVRYRLALRVDGGVEVEVRDDGRWRPRPADPGFRGRGLLIIDRITHATTVEPTASGTTVRFVVPRIP